MTNAERGTSLPATNKATPRSRDAPKGSPKKDTRKRHRGKRFFSRTTCCVCEGQLEANRIHLKVYCRVCENAYQKERRKKHPPSAEVQKRNKIRKIAQKKVASGKLIRQPCEKCGDPKTEMHHEDYSKPLEVNWLCRKCHTELHQLKRFAEANLKIK